MQTKKPKPARPVESPRLAEVLQFPVEAVKQQPEGSHLVPCCYCHADRWCVRKTK